MPWVGRTRQVEDAIVGSIWLRLPGIDVERVVAGEVVTVTVRHLARTDVPFIGMLLSDVVLSATVSMRRERRGGWQRRPGGTTVVYRWGGRNSRRREIRCNLTSTAIHATTAWFWSSSVTWILPAPHGSGSRWWPRPPPVPATWCWT